MHQLIRKNLEEYLRGSISKIPAEFHRHLGECEGCGSELRRLEAQSQMLRSLDGTKDAEPRAGFYARVMERIEAQQPFSIWSVFLDRKFGFRLTVASGALAAVLGIYLVTSEPSGPETAIATTVAMSGPSRAGLQQDAILQPDTAGVEQDGAQQQQQRDAVLVNLASYRQ